MNPLRRSEARLARRAAESDDSAFTEIFERYGQELYRYARAILGSPDDAQDALQNTMISTLRSLPGERRSIQLRPWLFRVTRNECISLIRSRQETVEFTEAIAPASPAADIGAEHREAVRTLVSDLASLPEAQRTALVLHELSGLSHIEISEAMQRSPRASRQIIYEARQALADLKEGRAMDCEEVRLIITEGDGRVTRGRKVRAHLGACQGCADFAAAISERKRQLQLLAPPLPAAVGSSLIATALGGLGVSSAGTGALGAAAGATILKSVAIAGTGLAVVAGGAALSGVDVPVFGKASDRPHAQEQIGAGEELRSHGAEAGATPISDAASGENSPGAAADGHDKGKGGDKDRQPGKAHGNDKVKDEGKVPGANGQGQEHANPNSNAGGAASLAPAGSGKPEIPPGQSISDGNSSGSGGGPPETAGPPAHSNAAGGSPPEHSNAGGGGKPDK